MTEDAGADRTVFYDLDISRLVSDGGFGLRLDGPGLPWGDQEIDPEGSTVRLWEDDRPLGPAHAPHRAIRDEGGGRFSHWGGSLFLSTSDNSSPAENRRRYRVSLRTPLSDADQVELNRLAGRIIHHRAFDPLDLRRLMLSPLPARRAHVFGTLGRAYAIAGEEGRAVEQLLRSWHLGRGVCFEYLTDRLRAAGRFSELWPILVKAALRAEREGDADLAVRALMAQHTAIYEAYLVREARPAFQDDVVAAVAGRLTRALPPPPRSAATPRRPMRIGYLVAGHADADYSSLPDIVVDLALNHDRAEVEPIVLMLRSSTIRPENSPWQAERAARLAAGGISTLYPTLPDGVPPLEAAREVAAEIARSDLDVLVTTCVTGWHFLICAARPAPFVAGLGLGEIEMFTSPLLDLALHFTRKPGMDGLCPSVEVPVFMPAPRFRTPERTVSRSEIGVPEDAVVLFASGRAVKFTNPAFWRVIARVVEARENLWCVLVGIDEDLISSRLEIREDARRRVRGLGWRNDVLGILSSVSIVIDTVPHGGAYSIFEAMARGVPPVGFHDDYLVRYREETWCPAFDALDMPENVFAQGDEAGVAARILALADDPELRAREGEAARARTDIYRHPERTAAALALAVRTFGGSV